MEKNSFIILGSVLVGYAFASLQKTNEIKNSDCETLKAEYAKSSNITTGGIALAGLILVAVGIFGK